MIVLGLGVLYHLAVGRPKEARFRVVTPGALVATLLWLIASGLFAVYTANFASYSKTYGTVGEGGTDMIEQAGGACLHRRPAR